MVRARTPSGVDGGTHEIAVYATGSTVITGPETGPPPHRGPAPDGPAPVADQLRRAVTAVHEGIDHARQFHARPGPRMGAGAPAAATREGARSEIIRPILLDPRRAWDAAASGQLFVDPIPRLRIDGDHHDHHDHHDHDDHGDDDHHGDLAAAASPVWGASLRTGWVTRRAARLHVTASPSFNVTVLELVPATRRRIGARSFLRVGLPVVEELARRLEASSAGTARSQPSAP